MSFLLDSFAVEQETSSETSKLAIGASSIETGWPGMAATKELKPRCLGTIAIGSPKGRNRTLSEVGIHDLVLAGSDKDRGTQVSLVLNVEESGWPVRSACS